MFKQYALDPDVVADGMAFAAFVGGLGVEHGRLMAEFPRKWIRMAFERSRSIPSMRQQKRAEILLERLRTEAQLKCGTGLPFDGEQPWLANAERHVDEFDAVIHPDDAVPSIASERMCPATSLLENRPYWQVGSIGFKATVGSFRELLLPLARIEKRKAAVMDPYFDPHEDAYVAGLKELISLLSVPREIVMHASAEPKKDKSGMSSAGWEAVCRERLAGLVDAGTSLTVIRWVEGEFGDRPHPRWIVTPAGGVYFDRGIALNRKMNRLMLMTAVEAARLWKAYGTAPFVSNEFELREVVAISVRQT